MAGYLPSQGLRVEWEDDFTIRVDAGGDGVRIVANGAGLRSLAKLCLSLARDGVPGGHHVHLDDSNALEDGSVELIIERN